MFERVHSLSPPGSLRSNDVGAPVSTSDVSNVFDWIARGWRWTRKRTSADHGAILSIRSRADQSLSGGYYVIVACAPARTIRPRKHSMLMDCARESSKAAGLRTQPTQSVGDTVQFYKRDARGQVETRLEVRSSGLIDLMCRLAGEPPSNSGPRIDVLEVARFILQLSDIIKGRAYSRLVRHRRKVDWYVGLTPYTSTQTGAVYWSGLAFPGRRPGGRASEARPACPPAGLAAPQLRSSWRRGRARRVVARALCDLLEVSGYYDFDGALKDSVASIRSTQSR